MYAIASFRHCRGTDDALLSVSDLNHTSCNLGLTKILCRYIMSTEATWISGLHSLHTPSTSPLPGTIFSTCTCRDRLHISCYNDVKAAAQLATVLLVLVVLYKRTLPVNRSLKMMCDVCVPPTPPTQTTHVNRNWRQTTVTAELTNRRFPGVSSRVTGVLFLLGRTSHTCRVTLVWNILQKPESTIHSHNIHKQVPITAPQPTIWLSQHTGFWFLNHTYLFTLQVVKWLVSCYPPTVVWSEWLWITHLCCLQPDMTIFCPESETVLTKL